MPGKNRQEARARAKIERELAQRAAAKAARRRRIVIAAAVTAAAAVLVVVTVVLVNRTDDPKPVAASAKECRYVRDTVRPAPRKVGRPPTGDVQRSGTRTATMTTNRGVLEFELDAAEAPCTVNSFAFLAEKKFFERTSCHRLSNQGLFVLQCGDPTGEGTGGPGYLFADENLPADAGYQEGTLAMASRGKNANGSQFYVFFGDSPRLPPSYSVFGRVTKGLDVVKRVAAAGVNEGLAGSEDGAPKEPVTITSMTVTAAR